MESCIYGARGGVFGGHYMKRPTWLSWGVNYHAVDSGPLAAVRVLVSEGIHPLVAASLRMRTR